MPQIDNIYPLSIPFFPISAPASPSNKYHVLTSGPQAAITIWPYSVSYKRADNGLLCPSLPEIIPLKHQKGPMRFPTI